jgi:uncharacterized DUF497 family protein
VEIEFDPEKREWTLRVRRMDFAKAGLIFENFALTDEDEREEYGEDRFMTLGVLEGEIVVCVWTLRGEARRIISLRKAEKYEREVYNLYRR